MKRLLASVCLVFLVFGVALGANQTTSSTTAATLITAIRYYLNEANATFWTDAELLRYINDGTMDIVARTHCLESSETESTVAATTSYALGNSFITIKGVVFNAVKGLQKGDFEHMGMTKAVGEPAYWFSWGNSLIVYPAPDATAASKSLVAYMVTRPTALSATSESIQVPAQYDKALILFVVAQALMKDEQYAKAAQVMGQYYAELDRFRSDFVTQKPPENIR